MKTYAWLVFCSLALLSAGCGEKTDQTPPAAPPLAVKGVPFASNKVEAERGVGALEPLHVEGRLHVYRHIVNSDNTPLKSYLFFFVDNRLSEVQLIYNSDQFDKEINREEYFAQIVRKYNARENLGVSETDKRGWLSTDGRITAMWETDYAKKVSVLTISFVELKAPLESLRKAAFARQQRRDQQSQKKPDETGTKNIDMGI